MSRISRDQMFMEIAEIVAKRGTCNRAYVGALLVSKGRIVSIGYNGSLPGEPHCDDVGHRLVNGHCTRTVHAEVNCIDFASNYLINHSGSPIEVTLYVTHFPCVNCAKYIADINKREITLASTVRIKRIVYGKRYPLDMSDYEVKKRIDLLKKGGVDRVEQFEL